MKDRSGTSLATYFLEIRRLDIRLARDIQVRNMPAKRLTADIQVRNILDIRLTTDTQVK